MLYENMQYETLKSAFVSSVCHRSARFVPYKPKKNSCKFILLVEEQVEHSHNLQIISINCYGQL